MTELVEKTDAEFVKNFVTRVCTDVGPGCPGTPQEQARAMLAKEEMEKITSNVVVEDFDVHPAAFLGWFKVGGLFCLITVIFFFLSLLPVNPLLFSILAFLSCVFIFFMLYFEFLLYRTFIDKFFPKKKSQNVIGTIPAKSGAPPKRVVIFSGHHDSALEFIYFSKFKYGYYVAETILIAGVIFMTIGVFLRMLSVIFGFPGEWIVTFLIWMSILVMPFALIIAFTFTGSDKNGGTVPGASDNLVSVGISLAIGRILKQNPNLIPADTEVRLISFGGEEAGCRGSRDYANSHITELRAQETLVVNYETIVNPEITIYKSDRNNLLMHNKEIVQQMVESAKHAKVPFNVKYFIFGGGGTDAMRFSLNGIKALTLFSLDVPKQMVEFYHQPNDTPDRINLESMTNAIKMGVQFIADLPR